MWKEKAFRKSLRFEATEQPSSRVKPEHRNFPTGEKQLVVLMWATLKLTYLI